MIQSAIESQKLKLDCNTRQLWRRLRERYVTTNPLYINDHPTVRTILYGVYLENGAVGVDTVRGLWIWHFHE